MPTAERMQFTSAGFSRSFPSAQEIDEEGNLPATAAFEMARQVGRELDVFWLGINLVQRMSHQLSAAENVDNSAKSRLRALVLAVGAVGESQIASGKGGGDIPTAV